ncbi:hypothetical protein AQJ46_50735 [Streptomyces canus]|uniref:Uncharacterized protein n=1 Tax=Streptomyces canus TaxID=58343 RepID=A0A117QVS9_9ACTN|nr:MULTISPECIES: hypothetical protein [Streptomyces]KUN52661.1 hypothetical protein AQJ46_50735 [Streptomyces canus]MDI5907793.1 hypothetical protein [Streptomyces sp. 12257]
MREAILRLAGALTSVTALPPLLDAAVRRLENSSWPDVAGRWSRLTPSGFPVELTAVAGDGLHWTAEVAGPELPEADRLHRAAALLGASDQAPPSELIGRLAATQSRADLRFGVWIGGREFPDAAPRLKLYAEVPALTGLLTAEVIPAHVQAAWHRLPTGTVPRMLGVEPARGRYELYARLPTHDVLDLLAFLHTAGHPSALRVLDTGLPDGLRRLTGRRLGLSMAWTTGSSITLALFASARTLFPAAPDALLALAPVLERVRELHVRLALVTIGLDPACDTPSISVGLVPAPSRPPLPGYSRRATA